MVLLNFFVYNFVIIDMYHRDTRFMNAFSKMFKIVKKEWVECLIYFLLQIAFGIASAMLMFFALIILIILFLVVAGIFVVFFIVLAKINSFLMILSIVIGGLLAILFLLFFIYTMAVVTVPVPSFFLYYSYLMVTELKKRNATIAKHRITQ